jgi:hypothetical protein
VFWLGNGIAVMGAAVQRHLFRDVVGAPRRHRRALAARERREGYVEYFHALLCSEGSQQQACRLGYVDN